MPTLVARRVLEGLLRKVLVGGVLEEDVERFLELRGVVSERWRGRGVLEEFRRSREHGEVFRS